MYNIALYWGGKIMTVKKVIYSLIELVYCGFC